MRSMFYMASQFNAVGSVRNMNSMFDGASQSDGDLSQWDVSNVRI
jgi:hypothetical protein